MFIGFIDLVTVHENRDPEMARTLDKDQLQLFEGVLAKQLPGSVKVIYCLHVMILANMRCIFTRLMSSQLGSCLVSVSDRRCHTRAYTHSEGVFKWWLLLGLYLDQLMKLN